jgi:hypothetical protein
MNDENFSLFLEILKSLETDDLTGKSMEKGIMNIISRVKNDLSEEQRIVLKKNLDLYKSRIKNISMEETYKDSRDWF